MATLFILSKISAHVSKVKEKEEGTMTDWTGRLNGLWDQISEKRCTKNISVTVRGLGKFSYCMMLCAHTAAAVTWVPLSLSLGDMRASLCSSSAGSHRFAKLPCWTMNSKSFNSHKIGPLHPLLFYRQVLHISLWKLFATLPWHHPQWSDMDGVISQDSPLTLKFVVP